MMLFLLFIFPIGVDAAEVVITAGAGVVAILILAVFLLCTRLGMGIRRIGTLLGVLGAGIFFSGSKWTNMMEVIECFPIR
jgi:hypothetical protein